MTTVSKRALPDHDCRGVMFVLCWPLMRRAFVILLSIMLVVQAAAGVMGHRGLWCLGGGDHPHHPYTTQAEHRDSRCDHDGLWVVPASIDVPDHDCGCIDVDFAVCELLTQGRVDLSDTVPLSALAPISCCVGLVDVGLSPRPPPELRSWLDPAGEARLVLVASVRLTV